MTTRYAPVAGCAALTHPDAADYDRRWLIVDEERRWVDDTELLATIDLDIRMGYLVLRAPGMLRLDIPMDVIEDDDSVRGRAMVADDEIDVVDEGEVAAVWLSNCLGRACRLVKIHPDAAPVRWPDR